MIFINFLLILSFYEVSVICRFVKVFQVAPVYEFGEFFFSLFFLIEFYIFYSLFFFSDIVRKIVLEKNHVIKLYKITKIKGCEKTIIRPTPIALCITIVIHNVLLFFFFLNFCYDLFKFVFVDFIF
jgi:hypothetical protein